MEKSLYNKLIGSILIIAGTQIGAGMLALPITTGNAGFLLSTILLLSAFIFMLMNIFVLLEATYYCPGENINIISIAKSSLGKTGTYVTWISFLLLLYSASAAYLSGGADLFIAEIKPIMHISHTKGIYIIALIFTSVAYFGINWIDRINRLLMVGLGLSYVISITLLSHGITATNLKSFHPYYMLTAIPIIVLSFTSHIVIPSIANYLENNIKVIKKAIIIGSIIPCLFYIIWELCLLGNISITQLQVIAQTSDPLASLANTIQKMNMPIVANSNVFFSIFALTTSFLGVVLSLCDFLRDGLNLDNGYKSRAITLGLSIIPPIFFAILFPNSFVLALGYAGVFVAILYCIIPHLVVLKQRAHAKISPKYQFSGNKYLLMFLILCGLVIIILQILSAEGLL